jgi:hypothetical protein
MTESPDKMLARVRQMAGGSPTWDLSPNDLAALRHVLSIIDAITADRGYSAELDDALDQAVEPTVDTPDTGG